MLTACLSSHPTNSDRRRATQHKRQTKKAGRPQYLKSPASFLTCITNADSGHTKRRYAGPPPARKVRRRLRWEEEDRDGTPSRRKKRIPSPSGHSACERDGILLSIKKAATYSPAGWAVPSARPGLTSLCGMGRGGTPEL